MRVAARAVAHVINEIPEPIIGPPTLADAQTRSKAVCLGFVHDIKCMSALMGKDKDLVGGPHALHRRRVDDDQAGARAPHVRQVGVQSDRRILATNPVAIN